MNALRRILFLTLLMMAFASISAYATVDQGAMGDLTRIAEEFGIKELLAVEEVAEIEEVTIESVVGQFGLTVDDLEYRAPVRMPELDEYELASAPAYIGDVATAVDYSRFGDFSLSSGFDTYENTTFACEKTLVGQGVDGMLVGVVVYTMDIIEIDGSEDDTFEYETVYNLGYSSVKQLGASGLFNESICLEEDSVQYVSIMVKQASGSAITRTFKVTTLESITKRILENIEIRFIVDEEVEAVEDEPLIDSFIDWFGVDQEIEF